MKMQIIACLSELVKEKFGAEKWKEIVKRSGLDSFKNYNLYIRGMDIVDEKVFEIINNTCDVLKISKEQAADAFGEYWVCVYAPKHYKNYFSRFSTAREFIMGMDSVHEEVTRNIANARPPRFDIEKLDETRIKVRYKSERKMIDFYVSLAKGIGKYFKTPLEVKKLSEEYVEINFAPK
ncbi:MAG: heme NO-binding domain-containing protein [Treponema sp.]|nr:heme NO-binding domain-containing protein [Treponema sp.]